MRASREICDGRATMSRNIARNIGRPSGRMSMRAAGGTVRWAGSTTTRTRGEGKIVLGGDRATMMRFHVDHGRPGRSVKLPLLRRFGDRFIDAERSAREWRHRSGRASLRDHTASVARTVCDSRMEEATTQSPALQMRSKTAGDAKADHAAIALPNGGVGDRLPARSRPCGTPPARRGRRQCAPRKPGPQMR